MKKYILAVVVQNNAGVLARVSSLFGRRGYNIESLTVSPTTNPKISRITIIVTGDEYILEQIIKQVSKLQETIRIEHLQEDKALCEELVFVKIEAVDSVMADNIREVTELYGGKVADELEGMLIVELTDTPSRIDAFLNVISNFNVIETSRTGVTAVSRGRVDV